jgi:hypothetical protein
MVTTGGAAALGAAIGTGGGLAAGIFFGPAILGLFGTGPNAPSPFDSFANGVTVLNTGTPGSNLLGPTRLYNFSGPYDTSNNQGQVYVSLYAYFYANKVLAGLLYLQSQSYGGSTNYAAWFVNPTGAAETITGIPGLTSAGAGSFNPFVYPPA